MFHLIRNLSDYIITPPQGAPLPAGNEMQHRHRKVFTSSLSFPNMAMSRFLGRLAVFRGLRNRTTQNGACSSDHGN
jgi:hypothetical protein